MPTPLKNRESRITKNTTVAMGIESEPHTQIKYLVVTKNSSAWKSPDEASPKLSFSERSRSRGRNFGTNRIPHFLQRRSRGRSIAIPDIFALENEFRRYKDGFRVRQAYEQLTREGGKASDCVACGECENVCPQHLPVIELLREISSTLDKTE